MNPINDNYQISLLIRQVGLIERTKELADKCIRDAAKQGIEIKDRYPQRFNPDF